MARLWHLAGRGAVAAKKLTNGNALVCCHRSQALWWCGWAACRILCRWSRSVPLSDHLEVRRWYSHLLHWVLHRPNGHHCWVGVYHCCHAEHITGYSHCELWILCVEFVCTCMDVHTHTHTLKLLHWLWPSVTPKVCQSYCFFKIKMIQKFITHFCNKLIMVLC